MNGNYLFAQLVQRLHNYADASVLWICLKEHADVKPFSTSASNMHFDQLEKTVSRANVQRSMKRLQEKGFIDVNTHIGFKTVIKVKRDAVLQLLREPMPERLPANSKKVFPFLEAWQLDIDEQAKSKNISNSAQCFVPEADDKSPTDNANLNSDERGNHV